MKKGNDAVRQRFTFTVCGKFPREREFIAHLLEMPGGQIGTLTLQLVMIGVETSEQVTQMEFDDNFPWIFTKSHLDKQSDQDLDSLLNINFRCQISLYPHIPEHQKVLSCIVDLSNERRADVLRRLALRGLRIQSIGLRLATQSVSEASNNVYVQRKSSQDEQRQMHRMQESSGFGLEPVTSISKVMVEKSLMQRTSLPVKTPVAEKNKLNEEKIHPNSIEQEVSKSPTKNTQLSDNEVRARVPVFRRSSESFPSDAIVEQSAVQKTVQQTGEDKSPGVKEFSDGDESKHADGKEPTEMVVIQAAPMKAREGSSSAASGLAAMMGGFMGMTSDGELRRS